VRRRPPAPPVSDDGAPPVELTRFVVREWRDDQADAGEPLMLRQRRAYARWEAAVEAYYRATGIDPCPEPPWAGVPVDPPRAPGADPWAAKSGNHLAWRTRFER